MDCETEVTETPHRQPRKITWVEKVTGLGALVAIAATITAALAYGFDALPFAKTADLSVIGARVTVVERGLTNLNIGTKENTELQLMARIQFIDDRLLKLTPVSPDYMDWHQQRNEAQQRLDRIRADLMRARSER